MQRGGMDFQWDDLRVFLAVARHESLSSGGRVLKMDPATVGRRVARLEQAVNTNLFVKSPQGYRLTVEGQRLMAHAEKAEQAMLMAEAEIGGQAGQLTGQIRIGAPDGCANFVLPQVCAAIAREHPGLELQIIALPRVFNLSKREADLAVAVSAPETGRLSVQRITDYHLHLAAAESYLNRHPPIRDLDDLHAHRVVGYVPDLIFDKELDYLESLGVPGVDLASNSVSVQSHFIREGAGLGIVHDFALPQMPGVRKVLTDQISLKRAFYLIRHADDRKVERLTRFAGILSDKIKREVERLEALT